MYSSALYQRPHLEPLRSPLSQDQRPNTSSSIKIQALPQARCQTTKPQTYCFPPAMLMSDNGEKIKDEKLIQKEHSPAFIEVTFLNKIVRLRLDGLRSFGSQSRLIHSGVSSLTRKMNQEKSKISLLGRLIALAVEHFGIKLEFMTSCHLYNIGQKSVVWEDSDLKEADCYFMFFVRSGYHLSPASFEDSCERMTSLTRLFRKPLFYREGRDFRIQQTYFYESGSVEEIFINESRKNLEGFHCPVLQCAKNFQKSCDLTFHFNIETGNKPYTCSNCTRQFRRPSALNRHLASCLSPSQLLRTHQERRNTCEGRRGGQRVQNEEEKITLNIADIALFKPSVFEKELLYKYSAQLSPPQTGLRDSTVNQTYESTVISLTCLQLLKNWSAHWEVNKLISKGVDEQQLLKARVNVCLQIYATTQLLQKIKPKPLLPRSVRGVPWID